MSTVEAMVVVGTLIWKCFWPIIVVLMTACIGSTIDDINCPTRTRATFILVGISLILLLYHYQGLI